MNLSYACADSSDIKAIYSLAEDLIRTYEDPESVDISKALAWTKQKICDSILDYTRIMANEKIVGYFHWIDHGQEFELDDLYILPKFRRHGIGTEVLRTLLEKSHKPVFLYVFQSNSAAISLYEKMGFQYWQTVSSTRNILRYRV